MKARKQPSKTGRRVMAGLAGFILLAFLGWGMRSPLLQWFVDQVSGHLAKQGIALSAEKVSWVDSRQIYTPQVNWKQNGLNATIYDLKVDWRNGILSNAPELSIDSAHFQFTSYPQSQSPSPTNQLPLGNFPNLPTIPLQLTFQKIGIAVGEHLKIELNDGYLQNQSANCHWRIMIKNDSKLSDKKYSELSHKYLPKNTLPFIFRGKIELTRIPNITSARFHASGHIEASTLYHPSIGPTQLQLPAQNFTANLQWTPQVIQWEAETIIPDFPELPASCISATFRPGKQAKLHAVLPPMDQNLLCDWLNPENVPGTSALSDGQLPSMDFSMEWKEGHVEAVQLLPGPTIHWQATPKLLADLQRLKSGTNWTPIGSRRKIKLNAGSAQFQAPPYMIQAVILSEDANFLTHKGIDPNFIKDAINDNWISGKLARGGSSITMQLVRNLWLAREKQFLRKWDEFWLTHLIEDRQLLSKSEILNLYLQLIEWGPEIYGLAEASDFYFGKKPAELSLDECLLLCFWIPNPKQYLHAFQTNGSLCANAESYMETMRWMMVTDGHCEDSILDAPLPTKDQCKGRAFSQSAAEASSHPI